MILLDTNAFVFDALATERLTPLAATTIAAGAGDGTLAVAAITLWQVAMLSARGRIRIDATTDLFLRQALAARAIEVVPITPAIAAKSVALELHGDPADRLIAATACVHGATLVTADRALREAEFLDTVW